MLGQHLPHLGVFQTSLVKDDDVCVHGEPQPKNPRGFASFFDKSEYYQPTFFLTLTIARDSKCCIKWVNICITPRAVPDVLYVIFITNSCQKKQ